MVENDDVTFVSTEEMFDSCCILLQSTLICFRRFCIEINYKTFYLLKNILF